MNKEIRLTVLIGGGIACILTFLAAMGGETGSGVQFLLLLAASILIATLAVAVVLWNAPD